MINPATQKAFAAASKYWWEPGRKSADAFISDKNKSFRRWRVNLGGQLHPQEVSCITGVGFRFSQEGHYIFSSFLEATFLERDEGGGVCGRRHVRVLAERTSHIVKAYIGAGGKRGQIPFPGKEIHTHHSEGCRRTCAEEIESHFCIAVEIVPIDTNDFGANLDTL